MFQEVYNPGKVRIIKAVKRRTVRTQAVHRLDKLADNHAAHIKIDLVQGIRTFKERVSPDAMFSAWESQDYSRVMGIIPWDKLPDDLEGTTDGFSSALEAGAGISISAMPPSINKNLRWTPSNPRIRKYLDDRTGTLIVGIQADTQKIVQNAVARSLQEPMSPKQVADLIRGSIGLYPQQERALANYKAGLTRQGVAPYRAKLLGDSYEGRLLDYRATMIARTETSAAINQGQLNVWQEGINQGYIDAATARKMWIVDGDPCPECEEMDGETVGVNESFDTSFGPVDFPPMGTHPNCYCRMELVYEDNT